MRVMTLNLNGIRSAHRKGFFQWMVQRNPDVVCLQETKAQRGQLTGDILCVDGFHGYFHDAEKKGYSGVAIYTRKRPQAVIEGLGWDDFDKEGRFLRMDFNGLSVISLYLPSGTSGEQRQAAKYAFMDRFLPVLEAFEQDRNREYIICGDWNIAHKAIDLKNWRANQKHSGFLPEERAWLDRVFGERSWVDAFRAINQQPEQYTWWSNRGQAWAENVGWRIDYQVVTAGLRHCIRAAEIYKAQRFSDHAPLTIEYDLALE